ncbi:MAG: hypothetical protein F6K40_12260 [Okeania sp. SIO3I5]|uniref:hypothetical protein n=1 Tax=Okeania sp. SIO3I5 TaxID=2607805 RepID=UPI0013B9F78B|nr:hypothetical protein [Okeania sp. SIO3I5]NEQ37003.1 hypothetical protein [Okeania sp. SIO3I5]
MKGIESMALKDKLIPLLREKFSKNLTSGDCGPGNWGYNSFFFLGGGNIVVVSKYKPGDLVIKNKITDCCFEVKTITIFKIKSAPSDECFMVLERDKCEELNYYYGDCLIGIKCLLDFISCKFREADAIMPGSLCALFSLFNYTNLA